MNNQFAPIIVTLPEGFAIKTNAGLHGNMQFFEMPTHQLTVCAPHFDADTVSFSYCAHDSDEGTVTILYRTTCGSDAGSEDADGYDVEISTGSDVWSLQDTASAIADAVALHTALGAGGPYDRS